MIADNFVTSSVSPEVVKDIYPAPIKEKGADLGACVPGVCNSSAYPWHGVPKIPGLDRVFLFLQHYLENCVSVPEGGFHA